MRVVSLCPSTTETLFELGVGASVVGRTKFCVEPAGRVEAVAVVGGTKDPKLDRIVALKPDLVLLNEEENRREDADSLRARGVPVLVTFPRDVAETAAALRTIAAAVGAVEAGERIAARIEALRGEIAARARNRAPVRFAYLIWRKPWMAAGAGTFVDALLATAGGVNVFCAGEERYPATTAADLASRAPDVILLSSEPFPFAAKHIDELCEQTGLARERFQLADGQLLSWHGSRTLLGLPHAEQCLALTRPAGARQRIDGET
ncbi:helical backbone metal receptor [Engelhardtia mirabilis]|uniref:Vitamin B12-binding protein n=1 Tax=Engelhardtia mirabilis TaxID=2528011 RepID=A0A518BHU2_9BACT|nr:Vitamin B12-binding protein precursor [Planctomycetes bacterium Pla133]QDV00862.1 Vitamin B12-binding protein precursor [Planctomycetes bacterium Pla86]